MSSYSAADIIGKTLIAKNNVNVLRSPSDSAKAVFVVKPGQAVGTVYSYLSPNQERKSLYWMFYDINKRPYYVSHELGKFDLSSLQEQGVLTTEEKTKEEKDKNSTFGEKALQTFKKIAIYGLVAFAGIKLGEALINKKIK